MEFFGRFVAVVVVAVVFVVMLVMRCSSGLIDNCLYSIYILDTIAIYCKPSIVNTSKLMAASVDWHSMSNSTNQICRFHASQRYSDDMTIEHEYFSRSASGSFHSNSIKTSNIPFFHGNMNKPQFGIETEILALHESPNEMVYWVPNSK